MRWPAWFAAFCALWLATSAHALVTPVQIGTVLVSGATSGTCTLGSGNCASSSSCAAGNFLVIHEIEDGGFTGFSTFTDTAGDTFSVAVQDSNGVSQIQIAYTKTAGLVPTNTIVVHNVGSYFGGFQVECVAGIFTADGSNHAHSGGSNAAPPSSGSITPSVAGDWFDGFSHSKLSNPGYSQASGFATPPSSWPAIDFQIGGYLNEAATTAHAYLPVFTCTGGSTCPGFSSTVEIAFTTTPPPVNKIALANLLGAGPGVATSAPQGQGIPPEAIAAGFTLTTWEQKTWAAANPYTVDNALTYAGGARMYFDNPHSQTCVPANTTLQGSSALVGECSNSDQDTLSSWAPGLGGGVTYKGKAFGNGGYEEASCAFTPPGLANGTWFACMWDYSTAANTATTQFVSFYPGKFTAGVQRIPENDCMEHFDTNFGAPIANYTATIHIHITGTGGQDPNFAYQISPPGGSGSFASQHRYGCLNIPATTSLAADGRNGHEKFYYDDTLEGDFTYAKFDYYLIAGSAPSTGSPNITMPTNPNTTYILPGYLVSDFTAQCDLGTISTYIGTALVLTGNASCNGSNGDTIVLAPPLPPAVTTWSYNTSTGVVTANFGSTPAVHVGQWILLTLTGATGFAGTQPYFVASIGTNTLTVQQTTGFGTQSGSGGTITPDAIFGAGDDIEKYMITGCMASPHQCTVIDMRQIQADDNHNIQSN